MKWNHNGIKYRRGCYEVLIAQFDGKGSWFVNRAMQTQQSMKANFKRLGEFLGASSVEVKKLYDDDDNITETNVIIADRHYDGRYRFYWADHDGNWNLITEDVKLCMNNT